MHLNARGESYVRIHWWLMRNEVDSNGHYVTDKHAIVTLGLRGISEFELRGYDLENVILDLAIEQISEGFRLVITPSYGFSGSITAKQISAEVAPGRPSAKV